MVDFDRLEGLIKEQGRTKAFLCDKAGKRRNYITDARAGNGSISDEALAIFARELGTTVAYLTGESDEVRAEEKPAGQESDELVNAIILGRDGKKVKRTYTKDQIEALYKLIDVMPYLDDEEIL
nr:MAG TPA: hypothetical protein [Bacteriophage sp.]